ncbi:hypothetical protein [Phycicoccus duodecadis]|uniref:Transcriptional regulator, AbiEi antitoxin, Type IV TA system n=1 Tax=Phycicoccus duodecadis TaxID=173053 RepID=A0A2N3YH64_9MICO|nr:hypothetical protein [Phycicoccus duodecadis]PKW26205.1 hypothetical protein ATL31_1011 [Phycicoccus duodecadis]
MTDLPEAARRVLARQDGVASRAQLLAAGVSQDAWRWNAGRSWRVLLPRVVLVGRHEPRPRQRMVAALLWAGPRSVLAGPTAASLYGVTAAEVRGEVSLLVPRPATSRTAGFATATRTVLHDPGVVTRGPLRLSSPARSLVDAAVACGSASTATAILVEGVQRRVASLDDVAEWVHRVRPPARSGVAAALAAAASGAWSRPEAELLGLVGASRVLSSPWANPWLSSAAGVALVSPDVWFDDVALAVMVHSHRFHARGAQWEATIDADAGLIAAGVVVVGVTPSGMRRDPAGTLRRVEDAFAVAARRPRPPVTARPRNPWARDGAGSVARRPGAPLEPFVASEPA